MSTVALVHLTPASWLDDSCCECLAATCLVNLERGKKRKTTPFGVNLMRSQVLCLAAQGVKLTQ